jgi:Plasmid pRiA4b ORF-3-like protein
VNIEFRVQLKNISKPPVWRKLSIPDTFTFEDFHLAIQVAFGWDDQHEFQFSPNGWNSLPVITFTSEESDDDDIDASECTLGEIFTEVDQTYTYIYDFGDDWIHEITVENITEGGEEETVELLGGKGKCPPEDCGGPWGYSNLIEILNDPKNPEHKDMKDWLGLGPKEKWDTNEFDLKATQKELDEYFLDEED